MHNIQMMLITVRQHFLPFLNNFLL
ncbi:hypothetical protein Nmel_008358 [Mimus melanotis]